VVQLDEMIAINFWPRVLSTARARLLRVQHLTAGIMRGHTANITSLLLQCSNSLYIRHIDVHRSHDLGIVLVGIVLPEHSSSAQAAISLL